MFHRSTILCLLWLLASLIRLSAQSSMPEVNTQPSSLSEDSTANISFPNASVSEVLSFYERLTGKRIIRDNNLANLTVTIYSPEPVPKRKAAEFIEAALLLNGVALVPSEDNTIKALSTSARKPSSEVVPLFISPEGIPKTDQVVSFYMPLKFITPEDAKKMFEAQVPLHDFGIISVAPGNSALLITESARLIHRLLELRNVIDVQPVTITSKFIQLQRADAEKVAELVTSALVSSDRRSPGAAPSVVTNAADGKAQAGGITIENSTGGGLFEGSIRLVPDARTNRILVISKPQNLPLIQSLISDFDQPVTLAKPTARVLRYVSSVEILPTLVDMLTDPQQKGDGGMGGAGAPRMPSDNTQGGSAPDSSGGSSSRADQLSAPEDNTTPQSVRVGKTFIVADPQANTILVSGPPENISKINQIIDELDRRPQQVYLATVIGQLTLDDSMEFGIDYFLRFSSNGSTGIGGASINNPQRSFSLDPTQLFTPQTVSTIFSGLTIYGIIGDTVDYYLRALETSNRFKILSRPIIYTANNKKAKIATGQQVPVPVTSISQLTDNTQTAAVQSNIDFKDVLLKLEVIPLINADGAVTLRIAQSNDSIIGNQNVGGNSVPIIGTQELNTTITVKDRQTIVLGGLVSESNRRDNSGIPFMTRIPGLGYLFGNVKKQKTRQELIIFIQPIVVNNDQMAEDVTDAEQIRTALPDDVPPPNLKGKPGDSEIEIRKAIPIRLPPFP